MNGEEIMSKFSLIVLLLTHVALRLDSVARASELQENNDILRTSGRDPSACRWTSRATR